MILDIFRELKESDSHLIVEDGKLKLKTKSGSLSAELSNKIKNNKIEIIRYLSSIDSSHDEKNRNFILANEDNAPDVWALSYAQEQIWMLYCLQENNAQFNMPFGFYAKKNEVNIENFTLAIEQIINRHKILRTLIEERNGDVFQVVKDNYQPPITFVDLTSYDEAAQIEKFECIATEHSQKAFKLFSEFPISVVIVEMEQCYGILINVHHIASDAKSMEILLKEISQTYDTLARNVTNALPQIEIQFGAYSNWQKKVIGSGIDHEINYWKKQLQGIPLVHKLPVDWPRNTTPGTLGASYTQYIDERLYKDIKALCRKFECTSFVLLQAIFALLIGRISNSEDVVMGTTLTGRNRPELESMIGTLVNVIILRSHICESLSFKDYMQKNKEMILQVYDNQSVPFSLLVRELNPKRDRRFSPIFQIMFGWPDKSANTEKSALELTSGINLQPIEKTNLGVFQPKNEFEVIIREYNEGLKIRWDYRLDLFRAETVEKIAKSFKSLIESVVHNPAALVNSYRIPFFENKADEFYDVTPEVSSESSLSEKDNIIAPMTKHEEVLIDIWKEVLRVSDVDVNDNFFLIGGHSLLANKIIIKVRDVWKIQISIKDIFKHQTVRELSGFIHNALQVDVEQITAGPINNPIKLSYEQQRIWFIDQMEPGRSQYNISKVLELKGDLNKAALDFSIKTILHRHAILRTIYVTDEAGGVRQIVRSAEEFSIEYVDLQKVQALDTDIVLHQFIGEKTNKPYALSSDYMLRVEVLCCDIDRHILIITMHHIASDGWSLGIFFKEFTELYSSYIDGRKHELPTLKIQYHDFAQWQRGFFTGSSLDSHLAYWTDRLAGIPSAHSLPLDNPRPLQRSYAGRSLEKFLDGKIQVSLSKLARRHNSTLFMVLNTALACLLCRYSNQRDIVIGSPIANREYAGLESLIGFFVNSLPIRTTLDDDPTFSSLLERNTRHILDAYEHQMLPFERLVEELLSKRSLSHSPIFQIMMVLHNNDKSELNLPGLNCYAIDQDNLSSQFDLSLSVREKENGIYLRWDYASEIFNKSTIEKIANNFELMLDNILLNVDQRVSQYPMLSNDDRRFLLEDWACSHSNYPAGLKLGFNGKPSAIFVLDDEFNPVSPGVIGEVYIAGEEVDAHLFHYEQAGMSGVFTCRELSLSDSEWRLYRTNILGRILLSNNGDAGELIILEHKADSVFIDGSRIDTQYIVSVLLEQPFVRAAVVSWSKELARLISHIVFDKSLPIANYEKNKSTIKRNLESILPIELVPADLLVVAEISFNNDGSINRTLLPDVDVESKSNVTALNPELVKIILNTCKQVLGLSTIKISDNYFEIGGGSIQSTLLVYLLGKQGIDVTLQDIFSSPVLANLIEKIESKSNLDESTGAIEKHLDNKNAVDDPYTYYPMPPNRYWYFKRGQDLHLWGSARCIELDYHPEQKLVLEKTVKILLEKHRGLRTQFIHENGNWQERIARVEIFNGFFHYSFAALDNESASIAFEKLRQEVLCSIDLSEALFKMVHVEMGNGHSDRLILVTHHLIIDQHSLRIFIDDFREVHAQIIADKEPLHQLKKSSVDQWAIAESSFPDKKFYLEADKYWSDRNWLAYRKIPLDFIERRSENTIGSTIDLKYSLPKDVALLLAGIEDDRHIPFNVLDILVVAINEALYQWCGSRALLLELVANGRSSLTADIDVSNAIGWFNDFQPLFIDFSSVKDLDALRYASGAINEFSRYAKTFNQFKYLSQESELREKYSEYPEPEIILNYFPKVSSLPTNTSSDNTKNQKKSKSVFLDEMIGCNRDKGNLISIDVKFEDNTMIIILNFSKNLFSENTMHNLGNNCLSEITKLVNLCLS